MANTYTIILADGTVLTTIEEGAVDNKQSTSLVLHGRGRGEYGQQRDQNLVSMLENFAGSPAPVNPLVGQTWFSKNSDELFVRGGSPIGWIPIGSQIAGSRYEVGVFGLGSPTVPANVYQTSLGAPDPVDPELTNVLVFINGVHQAQGTMGSPQNFWFNYSTQQVIFNTAGSPTAVPANGDTIVVQTIGVDKATGGGGGGGGSPTLVTSVFTRTGAVLAAASDYDASQVDNDSTVTGAFVDDALDTLDSDITTLTLGLAGKADDTIILTAGTGMTGGGDLSANRTFNVVGGPGIVINASNIEMENLGGSPGGPAGVYTNADITVDLYGRVTAASSGVGGGGSPTAIQQDLWETISSDSGSVAANIPTDTLTIAGGTGISTAVAGDTLTITNDSPNIVPALGGLTDVTLTAPSTGGILYKSAGDWLDDDALVVTPGSSVRVTENRLYIQNGLIATPSIAFFSDVNLGFYRRSSDSMGISCGGTNEVYTTSLGGLVADDDVTAFSDIRMKENLELIPDALEKVNNLHGYTFNKKGNSRRQAGVIAQEVELILPEVVQTDEVTGMKNVAYGNMVGLLIEAVKDLTDKVTELEIELDELRG